MAPHEGGHRASTHSIGFCIKRVCISSSSSSCVNREVTNLRPGAVRPGCFQKTKQEVLGWWVGKEKLSSRSVGARSISAFCASSLAPKDRSAHSAPLVLFCCGTAGKLPLRLASGAPRLAGEGAHGNLSMISCRLCSTATLSDLRMFHSPRAGEWAKALRFFRKIAGGKPNARGWWMTNQLR